MSVTIRYYPHPFHGCAAQVFQARTVAEWLFSHFGETCPVNLRICRGQASDETDVTRNFPVLYSEEPGVFDVLQAPGTPIQWVQGILLFISVMTTLMASTPTQPANVNRTSSSANNSLGERQNEPRVMQRVEDIVGQVRSIPAMMMQTYFKYINHRKVEYGYYCIGRGYHQVTDVRDGDTLLDTITGASAAVYGPFSSPNGGGNPQLQIGAPIIDRILSVRRANEVDGITLKAQNQLQLMRDGLYTFKPDAAGGRIDQVAVNPNFNSLFNPGDEISVAYTVVASVTTSAAESGFLGDFSIPDPDPGNSDGGE